MPSLSLKQLVLIALAIIGWGLVYVYQELDFTRLEMRYGQYAQGQVPAGDEWRFVVNKSLRFLFNDAFSLLFIYGVFQKRSYVKLGLWIMAFGLFILLPSYLTLAITFREEGFNLLVFLHRITMNPWLMLLLIPALFYQRSLEKS